jgi:DNA processing protein
LGRDALERDYWVAWSQVYGVGAVLLKRIHQRFGRLEQAWAAPAEAFQSIEGIGVKNLNRLVADRQQIDPTTIVAQHSQANPLFWTPADADYPRLLWETPDPPPVLYYRGRAALMGALGQRPGIAMVGTRRPSDYGQRWTRRLSGSLAQQGFTIISGLAQGVDTEAHRSCLAAGGPTIAVLGTGLDVVYPPQNQRLYADLLETGLALSQYPAGTPPDRSHFPVRNRIVAGLSRAVLVLEAGAKSGALITARLANDYGREVYALAGSLDNPESQGCLRLIHQGAQIILGEAELLESLLALPSLLETAAAVQLDLLELANPPASPSAPLELPLELPIGPPPDLAPDLQQIWQVLGEIGDLAPLDLIVQRSGLATGLVSSALMQLEMLDLVAQQPGMRYRRARSADRTVATPQF